MKRALQVSNISPSGIPYARLIVSGKKDMEIRNRNTRIRGRVGIVFNGRIIGNVKIIRVIGPKSPKELAKLPFSHCSNLGRMAKYSKGRRLYAWILADPKSTKPVKLENRFVNRYDWMKVRKARPA